MVIKIQTALDKNKISAGLFIDFSKAFDTVRQDILLKKLEAAGVRGNTLLWFESYLTGRCQYVEIESKKKPHY